MQQMSLIKNKWKFRYSHGGGLRSFRLGRKCRPLSTKASVHLTLKLNKKALPRGLRHPKSQDLIRRVLKQYSKRFFVKIEMLSINHDHLHIRMRLSKRSLGIYFLRVVPGQFAQRVTDTPNGSRKGLPPLWVGRPHTRVLVGFAGHEIVRNYIRLNQLEAEGKIQYRKNRLRGLTPGQIQKLLWDG